MSNILIQPARPMPDNVRNYIKEAGYVRGYFPELAEHASKWVPGAVKSTGSFAWNNMGKLTLLAALAAGGYYLYNKNRKKNDKKKDDDDKYYSKVPQDSKSGKKSDKKWSLWDWSDDEDEGSDYDDGTNEDVPIPVLADRLGYRPVPPAGAAPIATTIDLANQRPGSTIILKTSSYILNKSNNRVNTVKEWLRK